MTDKVLRNSYQYLGHEVVFKRAGFLNHKNKLFSFCYLVFIDGSLFGTVHTVCGHGTQFVCAGPDCEPLVFKNVSRVKAVQDYILYRSRLLFPAQR